MLQYVGRNIRVCLLHLRGGLDLLPLDWNFVNVLVGKLDCGRFPFNSVFIFIDKSGKVFRNECTHFPNDADLSKPDVNLLQIQIYCHT
jgi:hypothetical protein